MLFDEGPVIWWSQYSCLGGKYAVLRTHLHTHMHTNINDTYSNPKLKKQIKKLILINQQAYGSKQKVKVSSHYWFHIKQQKTMVST